MADTDISQKIWDALVAMNTAIKNVRLYPPNSPSIANIIDRLYLVILEALAQEAPIIFAESERSILICGYLLNKKDQEKVHITNLLDILLDFGIKSISFDKGLEKEELSTFIKLFSKKPDVVANEGGLPKIMADKNILHIYLDQKVYIAMDKDQRIISSLDIKDDQITQFLISTHPELAADSQKLQEMAKNPEWLLQTFHAGLSQINEQKGTLSSLQLSENLQNMLALLDKVTAPLEQKDRDKISQHIGKAIASNEFSQQLTNQNLEQLFGGMLLESIKAFESDPANSTASEEDQRHFANLKEKVNSQQKENKHPFIDSSLLEIFPKIIDQLVSHREQLTMEKVISCLGEDLLNENSDVRAQASSGLAEIIESLSPARQSELIGSLSGRLVDWIKLETSVTPAYKKVCLSLQKLLQDFIYQERFAETIPLLDVFHKINTGVLKKDNSVRDVTLEVIRNLASGNNFFTLYKEHNTNEKKKQVEAGQILAKFGDVILNHLLDIVKDVTDSHERVRIIHLIVGMGQSAIPAITERINNKNAEWYYLRNLAYIIGHMGNETNVHILQPLLLHEDNRVRIEALKSIFQIGGNQRGQVLLSALPKADDQFKLDIIETLGKAKCTDAVANLLDMLKNRPLVVSIEQIDLEENICNALGIIGSPEAIPTLSEIAESKSFFGIGTYPTKVKYAAKRALSSIKRKQK